MKNYRYWHRTWTALLFVLWGVISAAAQVVVDQPPPVQEEPGQRELPRRPYRGIFDGNEARPDQPGLSAQLSGFGGYDDNVLGEQPGGSDTTPVAGVYGGGTGSVSYSFRRDRLAFDTTASTHLRWYQDQNNLSAASYTGLVSFSAPLGRRVDVAVTEVTRWSPYYQFNLAPWLPSHESADVIDPDIPSVDEDIAVMDTLAFNTGVSVNQQLGRSRIRYSYGHRATIFQDGGETSRSYTAGIGLDRRISRYGSLRLGYDYQTTRYGFATDGEGRLHNLNLGGAYSRPLSFSRRTTVSFSGGSSIASLHDGNRYRVLVDATVHHEIGRTWLLRAVYNQGTQFVDAFPDPLYSYSIRTTLTGLLGRRTDLTFDGAFVGGQLETRGIDNRFISNDASVRMRFALTRALAAYTEYAFYDYRFRTAEGLPSALAPRLERHAVRAGISLWIPLLSPRQRDAAR